MNYQLPGKKVLVTGSTGGIGFATASLLHQEGASVYVNGRSGDRVYAAVEQLRSQGGEGSVEGVVADLTTPAGLAALFKQVDKVDVLVNNLGAYEARSYFDTSTGDWTRLLNVNLLTGVEISRFYLSGMLKRNSGRIVFVASETASNIPPDMIAYGVTKAAQVALARGLAELTAGTQVTVNSVLPGPTKSEGIQKFLDDILSSEHGDRAALEKKFLRQLRPTSLLQRFAEPEEVASLITYLASPLSAATNGAALRADGGLLRSVY